MATQPPPEAKRLDVFSDGITSLSYLPKEESSILASSSWDGSIRLHDTSTCSSVLAHAMDSGPLLSLAIPSGMDSIATGGLDGSVRLFDITSSSSRLVGRCGTEGAVDAKTACSCLVSLDGENGNLLVSASWSRKIMLWDLRQSSPLSSLDLPGKAFSMDFDPKNNRIVVATSGRRTCFFDVRNGKIESVLERESSLKFQTRCVQFFPEGNGIALGSVEGRVGVEFLDELGVPSSMKKYAFKCHRVNDTVYPVNCIVFHPRFRSTFATGGCDGTVVLWDGMNKKKLTAFPSFPTSVSAMAFNRDGSEMAVASSYTFEEGDREHPQDEIYIRKILDSECLPKSK